MKFERITGIVGLSAVGLFASSLVIFGLINQNFHFLNNYVSELGAQGVPNATLFNIIGFITVGALLILFGYLYGSIHNDRVLSVLLALFGVGFAFTAFPIDINDETTPVSKAHVVAICLGLAFWLFGLARMGYNHHLPSKIRIRANVTAMLLVVAMCGAIVDLWDMPLTHRLVFGIVFGWTGISSFELLQSHRSPNP